MTLAEADLMLTRLQLQTCHSATEEFIVQVLVALLEERIESLQDEEFANSIEREIE